MSCRHDNLYLKGVWWWQIWGYLNWHWFSRLCNMKQPLLSQRRAHWCLVFLQVKFWVATHGIFVLMTSHSLAPTKWTRIDVYLFEIKVHKLGFVCSPALMGVGCGVKWITTWIWTYIIRYSFKPRSESDDEWPGLFVHRWSALTHWLELPWT